MSNPNWPEEVRLKMIEKSEFYQEPQIYQYGFYDGYQLAKSTSPQSVEVKGLIDLLTTLEDYMADRADSKDAGKGIAPNEEMSLLVEIRDVLDSLTKKRKL